MAVDDPGQGPIPFFDGVGAVLTLIRSLAVGLRRRRSSPLLCLATEVGSGSWLASVRRRVRGSALSLIPHAYLDLASDGRRHPDSLPLPVQDPPHVLPVLHGIFKELRKKTSGLGSRFLRTYDLADWLTRQRLQDHQDSPEPEQVLTERLREKLGGDGPPLPDDWGIPGWFRLLLVALHFLWRKLWFRLWASGRIPIPGLVRTNWFMKQQSFPALPRETFVDFTVRLISTATQGQLERLLVDAFLHDLRVTYQRRPWRSRAWRRTARVLVLLDNVADDERGDQFLKLVATVRDSTRKPDPLLLVAGYRADADAVPEPHPLAAANAADAFDIWRGGGPPSGVGWRLWLQVPGFVPPPDALEVHPDAEGWGQTLATPPPPVWARQRVLVSLALVVVLLAGVVAWYKTPGLRHGCRSRKGVSVSWVGGQCVGYSDGSYQFNAGKTSEPAKQLLTVQQKISEQNRCATKLHGLSPGQLPYGLMTLVYFAGLTGETDSDWTAAQVAELEGLLTWQRALNQVQDASGGCAGTSKNPSGVALRVIIANGGNTMRYANRVARDHLVPLASRSEENVLGVIGMDRSTGDTSQAVTTLGNAGIPVVATTLSGDGMRIFSPFYFQLVPDNQRQALLVTNYAVKNAKKKISVYYPQSPTDPTGQGWPAVNDFYVSTLVHDVQEEATRTGLTYEPHGWTARENTQDWFRQQCAGQQPDDLIFFAGRYDSFPEFAEGMRSCLDWVLADDSVSRYVVQAAGRNSTAAFRFVSKGAPVLLAGEDCFRGRLTTGPLVTDSLRDFCLRLNDMYGATGMTAPGTLWPDERIGLAYDAAKLFVDIVEKWGPVTKADVGKWLRAAFPGRGEECEDKSSPAGAWPGATGCVDFRTSQIAVARRLIVIRIDLSRNDLPKSATSSQNLEADDNQPCKYVISGLEPRTTDCFDNPLPPLGSVPRARD